MVKKFIKIPNIRQYNVDSELEGHIFAFGRIGAGKSVSIKSILQDYHDNRKYKIWDIFGGERHEGLYWTLPSEDKKYWETLNLIGRFDEPGPKQYNVTLLYPYFEGKLPSRLPKKDGCVTSQLFTIPLKSIEIEDIRMTIGNPSESSKFVWDNIINKAKKNDTSAILHKLSIKSKGVNTTLHKSFIMPMVREKFIMGNDCDYNLDLRSEARNIENICVLCLEFVPPRFHLFIINYIIRKMIDLIEINRIPKRNILFIREAATFFRATDDSVLEDKYKLFRSCMSNYIRMGRRGTYFALDCQSPHEVRGLISGSEDYLLMFKTTSWRDKEEMTQELKRERRMRPDQIANLAFLEKGEVFIAETGKVVKRVKITLPRTMYWRKEYPNFHRRLWESRGGEWMNTNKVKDYISELCDINYNEYKEKEKASKEKKVKVVKEPEVEMVITREPQQERKRNLLPNPR